MDPFSFREIQPLMLHDEELRKPDPFAYSRFRHMGLQIMTDSRGRL